MLRTTLIAVLLLAGSIEAAPARHPFGWEDLFSMIRLSDPQPSPDGRWVLFSRTQFDIEKNQSNTDLSLVSIDGGQEWRLTTNPALDTNGRWLPDGSAVVFLSTRSGKAQLWKMTIKGGEPQQLSDLPVDIEGFELSPDGRRVLFWAQVFADCKDLACSAERLEKMEKDPVKARLFDKLFIRHWDNWFDGRRNHLFVMDLEKRQPVDLMTGMDQDAPTRPFGGSDEFSWSPDGKLVAFASKPSEGEAWSTNVEIYLVNPDDPRPKPRLISKNPAWDTAPRFSPDGKTLAWIAMDRPGFESDRFHLVLYDLKSGQSQPLAPGWDRSVQVPVWSADSGTIYTTALEFGREKIFAVSVTDGSVKPLVEEGCNSELRLASSGLLVFLRDRLVHPKEVFVYNPGTGLARQLSQVNSALLEQVEMSQPEEFWFENEGRRLRGYLLKPVGFQAGRRYPLAFLIHGGPQGSWTDDFHYRWNPQFYAGAGYVTVAVDFRGSTGYGQAFTDAIRGDWGPGPYSDLMAGLNYVLEKYPFVDRKRMCALGASFGGYMINWINGQDHPFQCLVCHAGDFDTVSSYYNTEELWFPEWEMTGPPWERMEVYLKNSPARFVERWKTPTLVIHGARDFRVVETEGFSTFNALQRRGVPSKFLYFPDETHFVQKPLNSRLWHRTILEWLDRWTQTRRLRRG